MRNRRCYRKGTWAFNRSLRFERFEDRLPFAVDGMLVEIDFWLSPSDEYSLVLVDEWIALPDDINDVAIIDLPLETLPVEEVFSFPEFFEFTEPLREVPDFDMGLPDFDMGLPDFDMGLPDFDMGLMAQPETLLPTSAFLTSAPLVDEVFSFGFDANESRILAPIARRFPVLELAPGRLDDAMPSNDVWISNSVPQASPLPFDKNVIEGLAIPVGEISFSAFEGEIVRVGRISNGQANAIGRTVITELSRLSISDVLPTNNPTVKPEGLILENFATIDAPIHKELLKTGSLMNQERVWLINAHTESFLMGTVHANNKRKHFHQEYQSLGKMLRDAGVEVETDSQLAIERERPKQSRSRQIPGNSLCTRIEIAYANAKLPIRSILEGMLPIGAEISIKEYNRSRKFTLNESFVAQTALICDDLSSIAFSIDNSEEQSEKAVSHPYMPENVHWVAIGSTLIVTHVSLVARKSYGRNIVEWIALNLPKFKKHSAN